MQQTAADWQFPPSEVYEGFNDAGIEAFTGNAIEKEGREAIQNALDPVKDPSQPVRVEIHVSTLGAGQLPGRATLAQTFGKCSDTIKKMAEINHEDVDKNGMLFYNNTKFRLGMPLQLVRISDYNTTGLVGAQDGRFGSAWYKLIKARGLNTKHGSAGGSFGIGKMASFVCSRVRTVFYGTRVAGEDSYIGVTRLQSYIYDWKDGRPLVTAGTGYYSEGRDMLAIPGPCPLRDTKREEDGTDVYILGANGSREEIIEGFRRAVLQNFFITIHEKKLVVRLTDDGGADITINRDTLGREIGALCDRATNAADQAELHDLRESYDILRHEGVDDPETYPVIELDPDVFGRAYGFGPGEARLLLKKGDGLNNNVLITRCTGMTLFPMGGFSRALSFTGILRITGEAMNELYRKMENPSHTKWIPERCTDGKANYKQAYKDLRAWIRQVIEERCQPAAEEAVTAYGMEEFFLADRPDVAEKSVKAANAGSAPKRPKMQGRKENPTTRRQKDLKSGGTPNVEQTPDTPTKHRDPGTRHKHAPDYVQRSVTMHLLPYGGEGAYLLTFTAPHNKERVKIELLGSPERKMDDKSRGLAIASAQSKTHGIEIHGNEMHLTGVERDEEIAINFTLALPGFFMMEANYYEAK